MVKVTVDGKNKPGGLTNAVGVEISDLDAKELLSIHMGNTPIDKRKVERFQLGRRQQVIMRILLDELSLDYMVRVEGPIDFSPAAPQETNAKANATPTPSPTPGSRRTWSIRKGNEPGRLTLSSGPKPGLGIRSGTTKAMAIQLPLTTAISWALSSTI